MNTTTYRVWYKPYGFNDEEDFVEVEAENEQEARRYAGAYGWVIDIEVVK